MPGSIGGFPIHNYGTDNLGRLGIKMLESDMDWDNKRKQLEMQSQSEVLKNSRELFEKGAGTGDLTQEGVSAYLQAGGNPAMVPQLLRQNNRVGNTNELQDTKLKTENAKLKVELDGRENEADEKELNKWKKIWQSADAAGDPERRQLANDNISFRLGRIGKRQGSQGLTVDQFINGGEYDDWAEIGTTKKVAASVQAVTDIAGKVAKKEATVGDLSPAIAAAMTEITLAEKKYGKDTMALYKTGIQTALSTLQAAATEGAKPKEDKEYAPTNEDKEISDSLAAKGLENNEKNRAAERMSLLKAKAAVRTSDDVSKLYEKRDTKIINDAHREAVTRTRMKFGSDVEITVENGQPKINFKAQGEAADFYDKMFGELKQGKRQRAVQLKLLTPEYLEESPAPQKEIAPPAKVTLSPYKTADEVKAAFSAGKLKKDEAAGILRKQFGFR
jgi:hypothetical protein